MLDDYLRSFPGQLVGWVLDEIRKDDMAATAWESQEDETKQTRLDAMADRAETLTQRMIDIVTAGGNQVVNGTIVSVEFKQGVKVVIACSKQAEHVGSLAMQSGGAVQLLLPQLALDLTPTQEGLDLSEGEPGWTPPTDSEDATGCTCPKNSNGFITGDYLPGCPVHGDDAPEAGDEPPDDDDDEPGGDHQPPVNSADPGDPDAENVG